MKEIAIAEHHLYGKAYAKGQRAVGRAVAVYVLKDYTARAQMMKNPEKKYINRIGISVSKKIGGAVTRNRAKRVIREGYRAACREAPMKTGYLIVLAARVGADGYKSPDVAREIATAFRRLGLYATEGKS